MDQGEGETFDLEDRLESIGIPDRIINKLNTQNGFQSPQIIGLVSRLVNDISIFSSGKTRFLSQDKSKFFPALRTFLQEYNFLPISRLETPKELNEAAESILIFLAVEIQLCRMLARPNIPEESKKIIALSSPATKKENNVQKEINTLFAAIESPRQHNCNLAVADVEHLYKKLEEMKQKNQFLCKTLLMNPSNFSEEQINILKDINSELSHDYAIRRDVLFKRMEVTLQSFIWSDKGKEKENEILGLAKRKLLSSAALGSHVRFDDLFLATRDVYHVERVTAKNIQCAIKKVIIPSMPDRGGRPKEVRPGQLMPSFRARDSRSQDWTKKGRRGGRGGWRGRGNSRGRGGGSKNSSYNRIMNNLKKKKGGGGWRGKRKRW